MKIVKMTVLIAIEDCIEDPAQFAKELLDSGLEGAEPRVTTQLIDVIETEYPDPRDFNDDEYEAEVSEHNAWTLNAKTQFESILESS